MSSSRHMKSFGASRRSLLQGLGAAAVGISFGGLSACSQGASTSGGEGNKLNFYNWDTYIGTHTLADFKKAAGIDVNMSIFATNDELFAKMKTGNSGFDVIVPSNDFVERLSQADLLLPLDHTKLPNLKNIDPAFMDVPYDPGRKWSAPYTWLVLGIGYRKSKMPAGFKPDSWKYLFESDQFKGKIAVLSEAGDMIRLGAKYLGHSVNGLDQATIDKVTAMLIKQKPNIKAFHEDNGQDMLLSKEVDLVLEYNGDIAQVKTEDDDIDFIIPKEGSQLNSDNWCIPKDSARPDNAHKFINYMMDAQASKHIFETILYPTTNAAAKALMPDSYKNNPIIFPTAEELARCEYAAFDASKAQVYEDAMTKIKAA
ncbi:spermidine/putrescine ABC transporter substrate-binding protein [Asticcacaulis sp. DW145]|uniref:ABC transporter substrate-binding protein n=1 Tax=Asticcacaulis sp. DW145 TaxID=3095608 RepID=UPI003093184E|nr:spermidine/putrescine ABC transporter substrate-binding protein [Asticcacaulis sp. DW145]